MMSHRDDEAERIALEILRYLETHPDAADTIEGVIQWWLSPVVSNVFTETVQRALDELVTRSRIVRRVLLDGTILYARR